MKRRRAALEKTDIEDKKREKLEKVLAGPEYMSSEEERSDDEGGSYFLVRPLAWRGEKLSTIFNGLDAVYEENIQTKRGKKQNKKRKIGPISDRAAPQNAPPFALK